MARFGYVIRDGRGEALVCMATHFWQNHFPPSGFYVSPTHAKWNHSYGHSLLSHAIMSPYDMFLQKQYRGSLKAFCAASAEADMP